MKNLLLLEHRPETSRWAQRLLYDSFPDSQILASYSVKSARYFLKTRGFDFALLDHSVLSGQGTSVLSDIKKHSPNAIVYVALGDRRDIKLARRAMAGVHGYLAKSDTRNRILSQLKSVALDAGGNSNAIGHSPVRRTNAVIKAYNDIAVDDFPKKRLSNRESEILTLIAKGFTRKEAADLLGISLNTASGHIKNIYFKLDIRSRSEAAIEAARLGLVRID